MSSNANVSGRGSSCHDQRRYRSVRLRTSAEQRSPLAEYLEQCRLRALGEDAKARGRRRVRTESTFPLKSPRSMMIVCR